MMFVGYRIWRIAKWTSDGVKLYSLAESYAWKLGTNIATCHKSSTWWSSSGTILPPPKHTPPHRKCECGFYAFKFLRDMVEYIMDLSRYNTPLFSVFYMITGKAGLWGKVVEHERGYRGQYAKVLEIYRWPPGMPEEVWRRLIEGGYSIVEPPKELRETTASELLDKILESFGIVGFVKGAKEPPPRRETLEGEVTPGFVSKTAQALIDNFLKKRVKITIEEVR